MRFLALALLSLSFPLFSQNVTLNSLGFLPDSPKKATIAARCDRFEVKRSDGTVVFAGTPAGPFSQEDVKQEVFIADFSALTTPGTYVLEVPGAGRSPQFRIADDVYDRAYTTAMRAMYLWRCGTEVSGEYNGKTYRHAACHLDDGYDDYLGRPGEKRDGIGGWHDAGDYDLVVLFGVLHHPLVHLLVLLLHLLHHGCHHLSLMCHHLG